MGTSLLLSARHAALIASWSPIRSMSVLTLLRMSLRMMTLRLLRLRIVAGRLLLRWRRRLWIAPVGLLSLRTCMVLHWLLVLVRLLVRGRGSSSGSRGSSLLSIVLLPLLMPLGLLLFGSHLG